MATTNLTPAGQASAVVLLDSPPTEPVAREPNDYFSTLPPVDPSGGSLAMHGSTGGAGRDSLEIILASDPVICRGFGTNYEPALLLGHVVLNVMEDTNVKEITLHLAGKARIPRFVDARQGSHSESFYTHDWSFLEGDKNHKHTIKAGRHVFPFQLELDGTLPATASWSHTSIYYKLRAVAIRSAFSSNFVANKSFTLVRSFTTDALEYTQSLDIENTWPGKVMYSIMIPHRAYAVGDKIPAQMRFVPLAKGVTVTSVVVRLKESRQIKWRKDSMSINDIVASASYVIRNGKPEETPSGFSTRSSSYMNLTSGPLTPALTPSSRVQSFGDLTQLRRLSTRSSDEDRWAAARGEGTSLGNGLGAESEPPHIEEPPPEEPADIVGDDDLQFWIKFQIPRTITPSHSSATTNAIAPSPLVVSHKVEFRVYLSNIDGHSSELRCSLGVHLLHPSLYAEARAATRDTRQILLGADEEEDDFANQHVDLPSYPEHILDRVANADFHSGTVRPAGTSPLHTPLSERDDPNATVRNLSNLTSSSIPGRGSIPDPLNWELHSELMASLGNTALASSYTTSDWGSPSGSRPASRYPSRAPSPEPRTSTDESIQSTSRPPTPSSVVPHSNSRSNSFFHLPLALKSFTPLHRNSHSQGHHHPHPIPTRRHSRPSPPSQTETQTRPQRTFFLPGSNDTENLLSRVPSYRISSRGFLGGGPPPLQLYRDLPSYDEAERQEDQSQSQSQMQRTRSETSIHEMGRDNRMNGRRTSGLEMTVGTTTTARTPL